LGPILIFVIPRDNKESNITTAFYSIHDNTNLRGNSFTPHFKIPDKANAIFTAE